MLSQTRSTWGTGDYQRNHSLVRREHIWMCMSVYDSVCILFVYISSNSLFIRCVNLLPPPDDVLFLRTAHAICIQYHKFTEALSLAIRLGDSELIREDFNVNSRSSSLVLKFRLNDFNCRQRVLRTMNFLMTFLSVCTTQNLALPWLWQRTRRGWC